MVGKISVREVIRRKEEIKFLNALENFICQDKEVEIFLKEKALEFDKRNKSRTYLLIDGCVILDCAISDIYRVQKIVGSRIAFLECADNVKVVNFYESNGFAFLQKSDDGEYLQMIRYL